MDQEAIISQVSAKYQINPEKSKFWAFLIIVGIFVLSVIFILVIQKVFLNRIYPLIDDNTSIYFEISNDSPLYNSPDGLSEMISILGKTSPHHLRVFEQLKQINGSEVGYLLSDNQSFWFIKNPREEEKEYFGEEVFIEINGEQIKLVVVNKVIAHSTYIIFGENDWSSKISESSESLIKIKKDLYKLSQMGNGLLYNRFSDKQNSIYGLVKSNSRLVNLQIVLDINDIESSYNSKEIMASSFFVETQQDQIPLFSMMPQLLSAGDSSVFQNSLPGKIYAKGKSLELFIQNPYNEEVSWRWEGSEEVAHNLELGIQRDLAELYPQIFERILPDGSNIPELIRTEGQVFTGLENGLAESGPIFTFPSGQVLKEVISRESVILSQSWGQTEETVENFCILDDIEGFGHLLAPFWDSRLWKKLEFSYNQQNLSLCLSL